MKHEAALETNVTPGDDQCRETLPHDLLMYKFTVGYKAADWTMRLFSH